MYRANDGFPQVDWVDRYERMPTAEDADWWGCVLIYDRLNGVKITGYRNVQELTRSGVTHWARIPVGPFGKEKL